MDIHVGILAIGNEVVEGQITNRNAAWLSQELAKMGAKPFLHLSCRDQNQEIASSLSYLAQRCHLVIISGGLGPTTDDCTRQSLSQWVGLPLEFHEKEWNTIQAKLEKRQVTLREGHKNQANLIKGAQVLNNYKGVAPGFFIKTPQCFIACLPGPPSELQPMFTDELKPLITEYLAPKKNRHLHTWICFEAPESEVAHIVESLVGDRFEVGYRLHKPYVEVKIWYPAGEDTTTLFTQISQKLSPWFVADSILSIRKNFHEVLNQFSKVYIVDHLTSGLFLEKVKEEYQSKHLRYQCFEQEPGQYFKKDRVKNILSTFPLKFGEALISLFPSSEHSGRIQLNEYIFDIKLPDHLSIHSKTGQLYIIEHCFLKGIKIYGKKEN